MKKLVSIIVMLSTIILFSLQTFVLAVQNNEPPLHDGVDYPEVKDMLLELGLRQYFVDRMTNEQLARIASSQHISSTVQYVTNILDDNGLVSPCMIGFEPIIKEPEPTNSSYTATYSDDYMYLFLLVVELGNGRYYMSTYATWTQIPANRLTDSLGIAAEGLSYVNGTGSGWFDFTNIERGQERLYSTNFTDTQIHAPFYMGYGGAAVTFNMHDTIISKLTLESLDPGAFTVNLQEINVHFDFEANVFNNDDSINFRVKTTYDHTVEDLNYVPSIPVDALGNIGFSITPEISQDIHRRGVELQEYITYDPD